VTPGEALARLRAPSPGGSRPPVPGAPHAAAPGRARTRARRPAAPAAERPAAVADAVRIVAWLSISAGAIHAVAMVDHFSHWWLYGVFFLVLTYGQVLWGVALLRKPPTDRNLTIGALANLAIVAVWLVSRTIGVPAGPEAGSPEPVGIMDVAATLDQLVLVTFVALIVRPELRAIRGLRALLGVHRIRIGMMLCSVSVFASLLGGHSH
jgi:predicted branched-subunit amino acid permease